MERVIGAVWVGMQSLEHAFKNNQRLEIKSRQCSTAQHISSLIQGPAAAPSVIEQNTLPISTSLQTTGFSSAAKATPEGKHQELECLCLPRSVASAGKKQTEL